MTDNTNRPDQGNGGATAEVLRRGARATEDSVRQGGEAAERMLAQGRRAGAEVARSMTEGAAAQAEVVRRTGATGAETLRRSAEAGADARRTAQAGMGMGAGAYDALWRAMPLPGAAMGNLPDLSQAVTGFWGDLFRTQMRLSQEVFRLANPVAMIELQQRMVHGYLDAILATQNALLGTARHAGAEAQRTAKGQGMPGV